MLNKNEITDFLIVALVLIFTLSLREKISSIFYLSLSVILILLINIITKKITGFYLGTNVEIKIWDIKKIFYNKQSKKEKLKAGVIIPLIISLLSAGYLTWLSDLVFDVKSKAYRTSKKYGEHAFSEITEYHIALIAGIAIIVNLFFGFIGYLINLPAQMNFVKLSIFFSFCSVIPISNLDGSKIFFGSKGLWTFLFLVTLIGVLYILI